MTWPAKLSLNDMVAYPRRLDEVLEGGKTASMTGIGLHIHLVADFGFERARSYFDFRNALGRAEPCCAALGRSC